MIVTTAITRYDHKLLDQLADNVDRAQEVWELIDWTTLLDSGAAVPCPECGGRGQTNNGVFGSTECFGCGGQKVVPGDAPEPPPEPPFRLMRAAVTNARRALQAKTNAIRDRLLAQGCPSEDLGRETIREVEAKAAAGTLGLPAVELPSLEELQKLRDDLKAKAKAATQKRLAGSARGALSRGEVRGQIGRGAAVSERDVDDLEDDDRGSDDLEGDE
jgi:hypothetical protein